MEAKPQLLKRELFRDLTKSHIINTGPTLDYQVEEPVYDKLCLPAKAFMQYIMYVHQALSYCIEGDNGTDTITIVTKAASYFYQVIAKFKTIGIGTFSTSA